MIAILAFIVLGLLVIASIPHQHSPVQESQPTHPVNLRIHERPSRRDTLSSQFSRLSSVVQFSSLSFRGARAVSCSSTGVDRAKSQLPYPSTQSVKFRSRIASEMSRCS